MFSQAIAHFPENRHGFLTIPSQNGTTLAVKHMHIKKTPAFLKSDGNFPPNPSPPNQNHTWGVRP